MLLTGAGAGILAGLFGVGGGVVIIPVLVYLMGYSQHRAQGTSLVAMLLPVGILAALKYYRAGNMDVRAGLFIALGIFCGAWLGASLSTGLSETWMKKLFAAFLLAVALKMLMEK